MFLKLFGTLMKDIDMGTGRNLRQGGRNLINHGHQIEKEIPGSNSIRNFSLPNRTATTWNILPSEVVRSDNVDIFKKRIDEHMRKKEKEAQDKLSYSFYKHSIPAIP